MHNIMEDTRPDVADFAGCPRSTLLLLRPVVRTPTMQSRFVALEPAASAAVTASVFPRAPVFVRHLIWYATVSYFLVLHDGQETDAICWTKECALLL